VDHRNFIPIPSHHWSKRSSSQSNHLKGKISDITNSVLQNTNSNNNKVVDKWTLFQVLKAAKQGAIRPGTVNILAQVVSTMNYRFDFRMQCITNKTRIRSL
jgi:hypothetical protein